MLLTQPNNFITTVVETLKEQISQSKKSQQKSLEAETSFQLALLLIKKGDFDNASSILEEVKELAALIRDKELQMKAYAQTGLINMYTHHLEIAIDHFFKVFSLDFDELSYDSFNYVSWIYLTQDNIEKSGYYLSKGELTLTESSTPHQRILYHISKGLYNNKIQRATTALQHFNTAYVLSRNNRLPYEEVIVLVESAKVWAEHGVYNEAERLSTDALETANAYGLKYLGIKSSQIIAECLIEKKAFKEANRTLDELDLVCIEKKYDHSLLHSYNTRLDLYQRTKNRKKEKEIQKEILELHSKLNAITTVKVLELLTNKERELKFLLQKHRASVQQLEDLEYIKKIVSHDLKEPLRNIGGYTGLLGKKAKERLREDEHEYLSVINKATERMDLSLTALLNYLSVKGDLEFSNEKLGDIIKIAIDKLSTYLVINPNMIDYESCKDVVINCDINSLPKVFKELIDNAIKFHISPSNARVSISCLPGKDYDTIIFKDNGIGIAPQYHQKIFDLFTRLDREYEGFGVGLAIVRKIVRQHGGNVIIESDEGEGTQIEFTISKIR